MSMGTLYCKAEIRNKDISSITREKKIVSDRLVILTNKTALKHHCHCYSDYNCTIHNRIAYIERVAFQVFAIRS
uniref:Uncharacterized protein n=1 Tax=Arundo donax TaxID=35708 RepID=A0A0A9CYI8_ARUDO